MTVSIVPGERTTEGYLFNLREVVNAKENPIEYLAIDPGKHNGVCGYDAKFYLAFMLVIEADDMIMFTDQFTSLKKVIIESYKVYPGKEKQHIYSDLETVRVIGRVESWTEKNRIQLIAQPASIKPTGYAWIGKTPLPKSNPLNHSLDAHVHAMYYFVKHGLINAADLLKKG